MLSTASGVLKITQLKIALISEEGCNYRQQHRWFPAQPWKNLGTEKCLLCDFIDKKEKSSGKPNYSAESQNSGDFAPGMGWWLKMGFKGQLLSKWWSTAWPEFGYFVKLVSSVCENLQSCS